VQPAIRLPGEGNADELTGEDTVPSRFGWVGFADEDRELMPQIDSADLDELGVEALEEFDLVRELLNENASE
jgi:hypothetical protein